MNLPSLPFDNLYKFQALSGLTLIILSFYIPLVKIDNLWEKVHDLNVEVAKAESEKSILQYDLAKSDSAISQLKREFKDDSLKFINASAHQKDSLKKYYENKSSRIFNLAEKSENSYAEFHKKTAIISAQLHNIEEISKSIKIDLVCFILMFIYGLYYANKGFNHWARIQNINDEILENDFKTKIKTYSLCQSCGKDFNYYKTIRGTKNDNTLSDLFCADCYVNGEFSEPDLTLKEMEDRVSKKLTELNFRTKTIKKFVGSIKNLVRWRAEY